MSGFSQNFSNYPPGVSGNEPELTGEESKTDLERHKYHLVELKQFLQAASDRSITNVRALEWAKRLEAIVALEAERDELLAACKQARDSLMGIAMTNDLDAAIAKAEGGYS
jgi:hypothetical protein